MPNPKPKKTASSSPAKSEGIYPNAHPTAPGGMSKANLRKELAERHGISLEDSEPMSWPQLIDAVVQGRLDREAEEKAGATSGTELFSAAPPWDEDDADLYVEESDLREEIAQDEDDEDMFDDLDDLDDDDEDDEDSITLTPATSAALARALQNVEEILLDDPEAEVFDPETLFAEMAAARAAEQAQNPPLFLGIPGIKDYVFDGHAGAGPSASERWMHCTMSLSASRDILERMSPNQQRTFAGANLAARQGTTAHAVGEARANHMLGRIDDAELDNTLLDLTLSPDDEAEAFDQEMDDYVQEWVDLLASYVDERGTENVLIEERVSASIPLTGVHEGEVYVIHGSTDGAILPTEEHPELVAGDLKYGNGIHVDVERNSQVMIYALGLLERLVDEEGNLTVDVDKITLIIAQPRMGGIKVWSISLDDLLDWRDDVLSPALTKALYGSAEGATFNPSTSACQFCPARGGCAALAEQRVAEATELFDVIGEAEYEDGPGAFPETASLSNERLGALYAQLKGLTDIIGDLKEEAQRRLHRGEKVPGFGLVNYTPKREWKKGSQDKIAAGQVRLPKQVRELLFKEPSLITPTQAEKVLGKEYYAKIEDMIDKPAIRPIIAPEGDRRKPWTGKPPESMFDDLGTDEEKAADAALEIETMFPDIPDDIDEEEVA